VPNPTGTQGQTLAAQVKYAPQVYAQNSIYSPLYNQLDLQNLGSFLNGSGATPGLLDLFNNNIVPALDKANTTIRQSNLDDSASMAPALIGAERAGNPGAAGLLDTLTSTAGNELKYGTQLTPSESLQMKQSVRGGQAARGMGFGPSDVFNESMADTSMGQNLLSQREGQAGSVAQLLQQFYKDPVATIGGMGSNPGMSSGNITSLAAGSLAPSMLSEFSPGVNDSTLMNLGYQSDAGRLNAEKSISSELFSGI
jgi:hypothetical protein